MGLLSGREPFEKLKQMKALLSAIETAVLATQTARLLLSPDEKPSTVTQVVSALAVLAKAQVALKKDVDDADRQRAEEVESAEVCATEGEQGTGW